MSGPPPHRPPPAAPDDDNRHDDCSDPIDPPASLVALHHPSPPPPPPSPSAPDAIHCAICEAQVHRYNIARFVNNCPHLFCVRCVFDWFRRKAPHARICPLCYIVKYVVLLHLDQCGRVLFGPPEENGTLPLMHHDVAEFLNADSSWLRFTPLRPPLPPLQPLQPLRRPTVHPDSEPYSIMSDDTNEDDADGDPNAPMEDFLLPNANYVPRPGENLFEYIPSIGGRDDGEDEGRVDADEQGDNEEIEQHLDDNDDDEQVEAGPGPRADIEQEHEHDPPNISKDMDDDDDDDVNNDEDSGSISGSGSPSDAPTRRADGTVVNVDDDEDYDDNDDEEEDENDDDDDAQDVNNDMHDPDDDIDRDDSGSGSSGSRFGSSYGSGRDHPGTDGTAGGSGSGNGSGGRSNDTPAHKNASFGGHSDDDDQMTDVSEDANHQHLSAVYEIYSRTHDEMNNALVSLPSQRQSTTADKAKDISVTLNPSRHRHLHRHRHRHRYRYNRLLARREFNAITRNKSTSHALLKRPAVDSSAARCVVMVTTTVMMMALMTMLVQTRHYQQNPLHLLSQQQQSCVSGLCSSPASSFARRTAAYRRRRRRRHQGVCKRRVYRFVMSLPSSTLAAAAATAVVMTSPLASPFGGQHCGRGCAAHLRTDADDAGSIISKSIWHRNHQVAPPLPRLPACHWVAGVDVHGAASSSLLQTGSAASVHDTHTGGVASTTTSTTIGVPLDDSRMQQQHVTLHGE